LCDKHVAYTQTPRMKPYLLFVTWHVDFPHHNTTSPGSNS